MDKSEEFNKIIDDFTRDLCVSYPELEQQFKVIDYNEYYLFCKEKYPENFFNILYENEELFEDESCKYLLPNINFYNIMKDESLSEQSKKTIWKYLQLLLFCVCNNIENKEDFGNASKLFEAIDENDLHDKIQETMNEMKNIFMSMDSSLNGDSSFTNVFENAMNDISGVEEMFNNMEQEMSGNNLFENMMGADEMKDHLSGIMNGKIGSLAKEIAQEASKELGMDEEDMTPEKQQNFLKNMFKNPSKILNIVKNIGSKLEEKFKSGDIKESELLEEAQEIMGKMKDMPGLKNMMSSMGMDPGGKFDFKGMANKMQQNMRQAKTKERMQEKLKKNNEEKERKMKEDLGYMNKVSEDTFVWNDSNSNPNTPLKKSSSKPKNNKKKNKGKKKKN